MKLIRCFSLKLLATLCLLLPSVALADPVTIGQTDTFEGGTTQNWTVHLGPPFFPPHPAPPSILSGGPGGAADHYMLVTAIGGLGGAGSKLSVINGSQWAGNYIAAGVNAITMDLNNFGPDHLFLRLLFEDPMMGPPNNVAFSTDAVFLPAGSGWRHVTFLIGPSNLTAGLGSVNAALMNATAIRLFHNPAPAFPPPPIGPPPVNVRLGVDNITAAAVPEPTTFLLLGTGLAGISAAVRKRRRANKEE